MKRKLSLLLIVLLLLCPMLSARADGGSYVQTDVELFSAEELDRLNARAAEIYEQRGVAVYFFFMADVTELIDYTEDFAKNSVPEENALILGMNDSLYYFYAKGKACEAAFTSDVTASLWEAFAAVKNDPEGKVSTYFDQADARLLAFFGDVPTATESATAEPTAAPTAEPTPAPNTATTKTGRLPVVDQAGILSAEQVTALAERLVSIGDRYQCDVVVVTTEDLGYKTAEQYADDFFDYNGYGYNAVPDANGTTVNGDGILLLVSTGSRDYHVSTSGYGITAFTDYGIQTDLEEAFLPYLRQNDYYGAFNAYADRCDWLLNTARKGKPYDVGYYLNGVAVAIAAIIGMLIAFIPVGAMKRQLLSVSESRNANSYMANDSFRVTQKSDVLLNTHVTRSVHVEPQRSSGGSGGFHGGSSTHTSSSGGSHGGHGGKF